MLLNSYPKRILKKPIKRGDVISFNLIITLEIWYFISLFVIKTALEQLTIS